MSEQHDLLGDIDGSDQINQVASTENEINNAAAEVQLEQQLINDVAAEIISQVTPTAPPAASAFSAEVPEVPQSSSRDENGFYVVDKSNQEEVNKPLVDAPPVNTVVAEADSSSSPDSTSNAKSSDGCPYSALCPYYFLACDYFSKIELPASVKDLLLWTNPKLSGAVFGSSFVLLLSLACCSLLTVVSSLLLLALTVSGSYRFYLAVVFRINGVQDPTFEKLGQYDVTLPNERLQQLTNLIETDVNRGLRQLKSILLWENTVQSLSAFIGLYFVYCIGSVFNTLTLLTLALVGAFSIPKIYELYKEPIDQAIAQGTNSVHNVIRQVSAKVPFLNKKKSE